MLRPDLATAGVGVQGIAWAAGIAIGDAVTHPASIVAALEARRPGAAPVENSRAAAGHAPAGVGVHPAWQPGPGLKRQRDAVETLHARLDIRMQDVNPDPDLLGRLR